MTDVLEHGAAPGAEAARVTVVICTRDRPALLSAAVDSVLAGSRPPDELLIIDQGDGAEPVDVRSGGDGRTRIRYRRVESRGLSAARNAALAIAATPVVAWTDDDVIVGPDWLETIVETLLRAGPRAVVTGRVMPLEEAEGATFVPTLKGGARPVRYTGPISEDPLTTFNMAAYRAALVDAGGFDERLGPGTDFPGGEDNELAGRLLDAGYTILYTPDAVVEHRGWRRASEYVALRWAYGRGQGAFLGSRLGRDGGCAERRLVHTLVRLAARAPSRLWRHRPVPGRRLTRTQLALGDLALLAGVVAGAAEWTRRYGGSRSAAR